MCRDGKARDRFSIRGQLRQSAKTAVFRPLVCDAGHDRCLVCGLLLMKIEAGAGLLLRHG